MNIPNPPINTTLRKRNTKESTCKGRIRASKQRLLGRLKKRLYTKDPKGSFFIPNSIMTKLLVLPLMLASTAGIIGNDQAAGGQNLECSIPILVVILEPFIVHGDVVHSNVHVHECLNFHSSLVRFNQCQEVVSEIAK